MNIAQFVKKLSPKKKFYDSEADGMEKWIAKNVPLLKETIEDAIRKEMNKIIVTDDESLGVKLGLSRAIQIIDKDL